MTIRIIPNDTHNPPGKLADVELHFDDGPLAGLKLIGFSVWERHGGHGTSYTVTFPARQYSVNGERRAFALLRPAGADAFAADALRDRILDAYAAHVAEQNRPLTSTEVGRMFAAIDEADANARARKDAR